MHVFITALFLLAVQGCSLFQGRTLPPPSPPIRLVVAQVTLEAPVTSPTDLYTFKEPPSPESEQGLLRELIDEVEVKGQRILTEQLENQSGFIVVPFADARRMRTNLGSRHTQLDPDQLRMLATEASADVVISAQIVDYGVVRWQYWVPGLIISMMVETLIVGAASEFNPLIMAAVAGSELITDVPFWWGGANVAGWALRPVRVTVDAQQVSGCDQQIWQETAFVSLIPRKTLASYSKEERRRKDVQLGVNLTRALTEIAENVGRELRLKPCEQGTP